MKISKVSKRNRKYIENFVYEIYTDYINEYHKYIDNVVIQNNERLEHILGFINTWTINIMNIANEYDIIKNIITNSNDISIHKNGKFTIVIEIIDTVQSAINCSEFGSIFSIYSGENIISSGFLRYSYIQQLVFAFENFTKLYNFSTTSKSFIEVSKINSPECGDTYFITDGKNTSYSNYQIYQFVDKLKTTHTLMFSDSIVCNFFHILTKGGVFLSTEDNSGQTNVKLLFQAIPLAFIAKNTGLTCFSNNGIHTIDLPYPEGKKGLKNTTIFIAGTCEETTKYSDIINPSLVFFD